MQKRWFGTFKVRKKENAGRFSFLLVGVLLSVLAYSEGDFSSLPEVEFQVQAPATLSVGDSLLLALPESVHDLKELDVPSGSSALKDLGWKIVILPDGKIRAYILRAGDLSLPSLEVKSAGGVSIARTQPIRVKVESAISAQDPKPKEAEGLRPPMALPFPTLVAVILGLLSLFILWASVVLFLKWRRNRKRIPAHQEPVLAALSEDQVALNAFLELEKQTWQDPLRSKLLAFSISEILKRYLAGRYSFEACESTFEEILSKLETKQLVSASSLDELESLFGDLDLVKFTDRVVNPAYGLDLLQKARKTVLKTRRGTHEIR